MNLSRTNKSIKNAKINLLFYFITLILLFYSRKIFLECLGADFIGLTGTLQNVLGYLNIAELGIGAAVSFNLYKPLQKNDQKQLIELVSLYGYLYKIIGSIVFVGAISVSLFFPLIFRHTHFSFGIIYYVFFCYLLSSLLGYFINYRQILLSADQKNYVVVVYTQTLNVVIILIQILTVRLFKNYYLWISIYLIASICECIILNWKIDKEYPWLKTDKGQGKDLNKKYPQILKSTKQIFIHKIKDFLLTQSDQIFIFAFVSLKMVAYYGNYTVIIAKTSQLFNTTLDSFGAGVGNLVAEGDPNRINKVFWELMSIRYFVGGIIAFSLYYLINPFITVWLGGQYVLGHVILILMIINCFIMQTRGVVDMFNHAYGHYADVWSAWAEGGINITITIIAGYFWGIAGILLGKIMSLFIIVVLWKPYYLFTCGFKKSIKLYWREVLKYLLVFTCTFVIMSLLIPHIKIAPQSGFIQWGFFAIAIVSLFILFYALGLLALCQGARSALCRIPIVNRIKRK